jgi:uncharacterized protein (TIGR02996 family)
VTDDEAFVRAIVAAPADDAPRLVYADWLEERGDPRGAYLRAELKKPRDPRSLGSLGATLDPIWVARVSRPPFGVCCDHFQFCDRGPELIDHLNRGPELADEDVLRAERNLGVPIPAPYRAFLLNHNGGPTRYRCEVRFPGNRPEGWWIDRFFSVYPPHTRPHSRAHMADLEDVTATLREIEGPYLEDYLPIAALNDDDYLVLRCGSETGGAAVALSPHAGGLSPVSDSLAQLLDWIVEKAPEPPSRPRG